MAILDNLEIDEITVGDQNLFDTLAAYERVHELHGEKDLRDHRLAARKNDPKSDKHCYGLFYNDPDGERKLAAVVYTSLERLPTANDHADYKKLPGDITAIRDRRVGRVNTPNTMVFYSVSNFKIRELRGQPLGDLVIEGAAKKVRELGHTIQTYTTLSPLRNFPAWLREQNLESSIQAEVEQIAGAHSHTNASEFLEAVLQGNQSVKGPYKDKLTDILEELATEYLLNHHSEDERVQDGVQRFHMSSGAIIGGVRVNLNHKAGADQVMVNYVRNLPNKETYQHHFLEGFVSIARWIPEHLQTHHNGAVDRLASMTTHLREIDNEIVAYQGGK